MVVGIVVTVLCRIRARRPFPHFLVVLVLDALDVEQPTPFAAVGS
jgi:hypothetical protein